MIETAVLTTVIAGALHIARRNASQVQSVWAQATWLERCALLLFFVPIPGPVDELIAVLVLRRVARRLKSAS